MTHPFTANIIIPRTPPRPGICSGSANASTCSSMMQSTYQSQSFLLYQMTATTIKPVRNGYQNKFDLYSSKHIHSFKTIIRERDREYLRGAPQI